MIKQFNCPKCEGHRLEEVMHNVTITSIVSTIDVESDECADLVYNGQTNEDGEVDRYQCVDCGFVLTERKGDRIDTAGELNDWILCHQLEDVPEKPAQEG